MVVGFDSSLIRTLLTIKMRQKMNFNRLLLIGLSVLSMQVSAAYPDKPITLVVPVPPGGILDAVARMIAPEMTKILGQTIVIENKTGAGGNIAATAVAKAAPDGYTLLLGYSMFHVGNPSMYANLAWDPIRDFAPVSMLVVSPHVLAVNPTVPVNTLQELVTYAKANPAKLNYATSGNGSVPHIGMELFKQQNQLNITHVPYRGAGPAMLDVIAGNVQMTVATPPSLMQFVQQGKMRALAVAAKKRIPQMPDVPTSAEAGFPGFELEAWIGIFAPSATPPTIVSALNDAARTTLQNPQVKMALEKSGVELRYMNSVQFDTVIRKDIQYWSKVIKTANITVD